MIAQTVFAVGAVLLHHQLEERGTLFLWQICLALPAVAARQKQGLQAGKESSTEKETNCSITVPLEEILSATGHSITM